MSTSVRWIVFEGREPFLASLYIGVPALTLAALGAVLPGPRLRFLALGGAVFFLLAALGRYTPFYTLLLSIPFVSLLRYPTKYMIGVSFFVAVLAGLGVLGWARSWSEAERRRALGIGLVALALSGGAAAAAELVRRGGLDLARYAIAGADLGATVSRLRWTALGSAVAGLLLLARARAAGPGGWTRGAMAAIALADAVAVGQGVNVLAPAELMAHRPPIVDHLRSAAPMARVFSVPTSPEWLNSQLSRGPAGWKPEWRWALGLQEMLSPPTSGRWGIGGSYDGELTGLGPPALSGWSIALMRARDPLALRALRLGNVGAVVHVRQATYRGLPPEAEFPSVFASPIRLTRVPDPLPWAYVAGGWREASDHDAPALLVSPDFDPTREVVLTPGRGPRPVPGGFAGGARLLWRRADALALETVATHPALAVVVEGYHRDWKATVDGRPAEVVKANTLFRAVDVPAGRHAVEMRYRPRAAAWGAALSASGLGLLAALVLGRRRSPRPGIAIPAARR